MTYTIVVERELCSGFGACVAEDPESFALDAGGVAVARVLHTTRAQALAAARACPMGAIRVLDADGRDLA